MKKYEVFFTEPFEKCLGKLAKKYLHIKDDMKDFLSFLEIYPDAGIPIPGYIHKVWKIRWKSMDMAKGKRGGYRIVYFWNRKDTEESHYSLVKPTYQQRRQSEYPMLLLEPIISY